MLFWGMLLGGIPNLLIAAGLVVLSSRLGLVTGRLARVGYVLVLFGLIVPALIDLSIRALGAPFFLPVAATGLMVLAVETRHNPCVGRESRALLAFIGVSLAIAFAWACNGQESPARLVIKNGWSIRREAERIQSD
jgi:hypothetical protein